MKDDVRQRTRQYPANEAEEAVEAVLRTLRTDVLAARDLVLAGGQRQGELAELAERIRLAASSLIDRWPRLDRQSPYRLASLEEAIALTTELADLGAARHVKPMTFADSLASLFTVKARALLSDKLRAARGARSIRTVARQLDVALGYMSDLESGRAGPPSVAVLQKISDGLGIDVEDIRSAMSSAETFKAAHRQHEARRRRSQSATRDYGPGNFQAQLSMTPVHDQAALQLADMIQRLPASIRQGLLNLVGELATTYGESPRSRNS